MSCYLVTGAAGFIASKVCEFLLAEGHTVVGVDNLNDYYDVRLKDYRLSRLLGRSYSLSGDPKRSIFANSSQASALSFQGFHFRHLDIENLPALEALFAEFRFEAVFNLAARAGVRYSMENPYVYLSTNTLGTLNILECMRRHGVKKHVLASTSSLYAGCAMPFTEDLPVNTPLSPYAATKKGAELMAYSYHKLYGLDISIVRYFTVFGPAGRPDMAPFRFIKWIDEGTPITLFGDGSQSRDFTYVDDIARGTILAGKLFGGQMSDVGRQSSAPGYEIVNLGGGARPMTMLGFIRLMETFAQRPAKIHMLPAHKADVLETWANVEKAKLLLGWRPEIDVGEGVRRLVAWHRSTEWLVRQVVL